MDDKCGNREKERERAAGLMEMTRTVRYSLIALRLYLIAMIALAVYRTMVLAGFLSR